jgi:hypothetical protein
LHLQTGCAQPGEVSEEMQVRLTTTNPRSVGVAVVILLTAAACSSGPASVQLTGIPAAWYTAITDAVNEQPAVGSVALLENGGPCPLGNAISVDGHSVTDVSDHGVVRLDGGVPAVSCSWYEGTPIEVTVARALDDAGYAELVSGTRPRQQAGNQQTGQEVIVGARTLQVVRTQYPTNPSAGTDFEAYYLDPASRGRISLLVNNSSERSAGYHEAAVAADLAGFLNG